MQLPEFIRAFHGIDLPMPQDAVSTHAIRSEQGLMVIFSAHKDIAVPPHSHKGQWGTVLEGELELTIGGQTRVYKPGESYDIPSGVEHSARLSAGSKVIDIFEEPDRYALRS
ncbi:cupin domain-containing protein [Oricola sp.]|uniref:cupin domain-containing protein n=1 Tax=Oricola sp. TaxID=1979950 RepID=UPI0025F3F618|nr:cupin domain-containing protein [Oricola sp.]MCI5077846.1 cupin domain-containing protein [Oricola sp.]